MEFEERKMQMKLERLSLKREADRSAGEGGEANQAGGARVVFGGTRSPDLPHFVDGKDDLDQGFPNEGSEWSIYGVTNWSWGR